MNLTDAHLIKQIQQATSGAARLLCTLARRGKALERDQPQRAQFLLDAVHTHPLYKGGRLTFDMLEIEDLILEGSSISSMNTTELNQLLASSAHRLVETLQQMGSVQQTMRTPAGKPSSEADVQTSRDLTEAKDEPLTAILIPRLSFGPADNEEVVTPQSLDNHERGEPMQSEPELLASDYLYDYVVLGFLDLIGRYKGPASYLHL
jgi:hypothetical protein